MIVKVDNRLNLGANLLKCAENWLKLKIYWLKKMVNVDTNWMLLDKI